jgi:hypothetical protein
VGAGSAGSNYFYVGDGVDDYTWTEVYFDGSPPSVFAPTLPVSVVSHVQAIAPVYVYDTSTNVSALKMYALASMDPNGNNRWVEKYDWLSNTWVDLEDGNGNQLYLYSLTTDNSSTSGAVSNAPFWGWTYFIGNTTWGSIYTGETGNIWNDSGTWGGVYVTSVAVASQTAVYATSNVDVCPGLNVTYPITYEACIIQYYKSGNFPGGSWVQSDTGAEQLAVDATTQTLYALDNAGGTSGNVWVSSGGTWSALGTTQCASPSTQQRFAQIVAKNNVVFGLGPYGTVWFYTTAHGCWTQVGSKTYWATSLATDNGETFSVWAVDTSGNLWTAN